MPRFCFGALSWPSKVSLEVTKISHCKASVSGVLCPLGLSYRRPCLSDVIYATFAAWRSLASCGERGLESCVLQCSLSAYLMQDLVWVRTSSYGTVCMYKCSVTVVSVCSGGACVFLGFS